MKCLLNKSKKTGFTLIELLIVIAIILILIAIALPNFMAARTRAVVTQALAEIRSLSIAIESYSTDHQAKYPHLPGNILTNGGQQWNRNGVHLMWNLTSPVEYVESEVIKRGDPFLGTYPRHPITGRLEAAHINGSHYYSYGYINVDMYREGSSNSNRRGNITVHYVLLSLGPDAQKGPDPRDGSSHNYSDYGKNAGAPFYDQRFTAWNYSATNGTRSKGDLLRIP